MDLDVVHDAHAVAEALGARELERLPDRREPERLAGMDRDVEVLASDQVEGVEIAGGRIALLGTGDIEADDPINDALDAAYRSKYRRYVGPVASITSGVARSTTLKLVPQQNN